MEGTPNMITVALIEFYLPVRPFSPIDAHNRAAAALGSPRYAGATHYVDYNGHHVSLRWNSYRGYYIAEYFWAGRQVLCRGQFAACLDAVISEYDRGALGASASVYVRADDEAALAICRANPRLIEGSLWVEDENGRSIDHGPWWTWRHSVGHESARDMANPQCPVLVFDWAICQAVETREAYEAAILAKYGRVYQ